MDSPDELLTADLMAGESGKEIKVKHAFSLPDSPLAVFWLDNVESMREKVIACIGALAFFPYPVSYAPD